MSNATDVSEPINCVFCGLDFRSLEQVELHITAKHNLASSSSVISSGSDQTETVPSTPPTVANPGHRGYLSVTHSNNNGSRNHANSLQSGRKSAWLKTDKGVSDVKSESIGGPAIQTNGHSSRKSKTRRGRRVSSRCGHCLHRVLFKPSLEAHRRVHTLCARRNKTRCKLCGFRFHRKTLLQLHLDKHSCHSSQLSTTNNSATLHCPNCDVSFAEPKYLDAHLLRICQKIPTQNGVKHSPQRKIEKVVLPAIPQQKTPELKEYRCEVCQKTFSNRSSLSNHVKSHNSRRGQPFVCRECGIRFVNLLTLQNHRRDCCHDDDLAAGRPQIKTKTVSSPSTSQKSNSSSSTTTTTKSSPSVKTSYLSNFNGVSQVPLWPVSRLGLLTSDEHPDDRDSGSHSQPPQPPAVTCVHCGDVFYDRLRLEEHAMARHCSDSGQILCLLCERMFTTNMALRVHLTKSHGFANGGCPGVSQTLPPLPRLLSSASTTKSRRRRRQQQQLLAVRAMQEQKVPTDQDAQSPVDVAASRHQCDTCLRHFSTVQALGNHRRACFNELNHLAYPVDMLHSARSYLSGYGVNTVAQKTSHSIESLISDNNDARRSIFKHEDNIFLAFN